MTDDEANRVLDVMKTSLLTETGHGGDGESSLLMFKISLFYFLQLSCSVNKPSGGRDQLLFEGVACWRWNTSRNVVKTELSLLDLFFN